MLVNFNFKRPPILLILIFFINNCLHGQDRDLWVKDIRLKYNQIRANVESYDTTMIDIWGQSTEGGSATGYYDKEYLKLIEVVWYGETGRRQIEYYFDQGELIFSFDFRVFYNRPIYWDEEAAKEMGDNEIFDPKKSKIEEDRYYFKNEKLFLWINKNKEKEDLTTEANSIVGQSLIYQCYKIRGQLKN